MICLQSAVRENCSSVSMCPSCMDVLAITTLLSFPNHFICGGVKRQPFYYTLQCEGWSLELAWQWQLGHAAQCAGPQLGRLKHGEGDSADGA